MTRYHENMGEDLHIIRHNGSIYHIVLTPWTLPNPSDQKTPFIQQIKSLKNALEGG